MTDNTVTKDIHVRIAGPNQSEEKIAEYHLLFYFQVTGLSKYTSATEKPGLDPDFNGWLSNIVLATTRGIMYADLRGTFLDQALLPLINPAILKE
jgi:hypothetical protein